jgi:biotin transport system permease protein/energy-coupling factor transport system permease protein
MALTQNSIFKYKTVKGPLHKLPALLKLILIWPISIFCMTLHPFWLGIGIATASITAFFCRFTLREQLTDIKPAFFYAFLMYTLSLFSSIMEIHKLLPELSYLTALIPKPDFIRIALRLVLIMQLSSLLFRSTTSGEIRDGLHTMEQVIRRFLSRVLFFQKKIAPNGHFAENISLFLCFIPEIFETWSVINLAWKARGGKGGLEKIRTTVFVLISLSMERAAVKAKALAARQ